MLLKGSRTSYEFYVTLDGSVIFLCYTVYCWSNYCKALIARYMQNGFPIVKPNLYTKLQLLTA